MAKSAVERRKYTRYDTEMKLYFRVKYDIETKVKFRVLRSGSGKISFHRYSGLCRNVSAEGICFSSRKRLQKGERLLIEVFEPIVKSPVIMEGEVRWSRRDSEGGGRYGPFRTGVCLISVNGLPVADSVHLDKKYRVAWSVVLDSLFGNFAAMVRRLKK